MLCYAVRQVPTLWAQLAELYAQAGGACQPWARRPREHLMWQVMRERGAAVKPSATRWCSKMLENFWNVGQIVATGGRALHITRPAVQSCFSAYATLFSQASTA